MKKQKIIIGSVVAILLLAGFVYFGFKNNIFADITILNPNSFGNGRIKFSVVDNALKLTIYQLGTNTPQQYPSPPFHYTRMENKAEVDGTFNFASLATLSQGKVLTLSDTTKNVSFDINVITKSNYLTFEIAKVTKPDNVDVKRFVGAITFSQISSDDYSFLVPRCLTSNCDYTSYNINNPVLSLDVFNLPNFPLEHSKLLLITADHNQNTIEFLRTGEAVKKDLGIDRNDSYDPTFFAATGDYVYNKTNAELVAKKLNSFGYKRILILDANWQKSRGLWDLNTTAFPDGLKPIVDIFHQYGIQVGLHSLTATVTTNNALYTPTLENIAKDATGSPILPQGYPQMYLVNYLNPAVLSNLVDNLTSNLKTNGIDFFYIDGSEWFGLEKGADVNVVYSEKTPDGVYRAINNEFINEFANKIKIDFQASVTTAGDLYVDKYALTDIWQTQSDTAHPNDIKYWLDNTVIINSSQHSSGREMMGLRRASLLVPNFGWTPLNLAEDPEHYAYALSAAIANGAPLTTEADLNTFMTDPRVDKFQSIFKERLDIWNQISANSVETNPVVPSYTPGERLIQFDSDVLGVTLPKVPGDTYNLDAGSNRRIFVDPWSGTKTTLKISFSNLKPNTKYVLDSAKKLAGISFETASETTYTATVPIDANTNDYFFLTLTQGGLISYTFPKGFSTFGVTKSMSSSSIISNTGFYVYQFDGPNNKWLMTPADSFTLEPSKGYYVYNQSDTKTISLPYDTFATNPYSLTQGWNLLHSSSSKQRSDIKLTLTNQSNTIDELVNQNKIHPKIFIVDNEQSKDSCSYFSLLDVTDTVANCAINSLEKQKTIPAGKTFWVYVK